MQTMHIYNNVYVSKTIYNYVYISKTIYIIVYIIVYIISKTIYIIVCVFSYKFSLTYTCKSKVTNLYIYKPAHAFKVYT